MLQPRVDQGRDGGQSYRDQPPANHNTVSPPCLSLTWCLSVMGTCLDTRTQYLLLTDEHEEDDLVPDLPEAQTLLASLQSKIHFRSTYQISLSIVSNLSSSSQYWAELDLIMID